MMQGKEAAIDIYMTTVLVAIRVLVPVAIAVQQQIKAVVHLLVEKAASLLQTARKHTPPAVAL